MGHWTNSSKQTLSSTSGEVIIVDFDQEIIPGSQTALQDGVYDYSYHLNLQKSDDEVGPSRVTSVVAIRRFGQSVETIRETRSFTEIDIGTEQALTHTGQVFMNLGDIITIRVNLDSIDQIDEDLEVHTRLKKQQCSLSFALTGASAAGNFANTSFPVNGLLIGQEHYRTDINTPFHWNGAKWLGDMMIEAVGRDGTQDSNTYLRRLNGMIETTTRGCTVPFDATIVGFSWSMANGIVGDFEVRRNGIVVSTIPTNGQAIGGTMSLDDDFAENGVMTTFWSSTSACNAVQVTIYYRHRG